MLVPEVSGMSQSRLIGVIGLVTWLLVALPALLYHVPALFRHEPFIDWRWIVAFLIPRARREHEAFVLTCSMLAALVALVGFWLFAPNVR